MTLQSVSQAIQNTELFTAMRESALVYPIVLSLHLTCIALFGGMILMTNLRLLGWALNGVPASDIFRQTRNWKRLGFVVMVTCGVLLGGSKLETYYDNPYFQVKLTLLTLVAVHAIVFQRSVYANFDQLDRLTAMPRVVKIAAVTSLMLWIGILSMGRWIAYYERPDPAHPPRAASR